MGGQQERVVVGRQAHEPGAHERRVGQVEGFLRFFCGDAKDGLLPLCLRQCGQVVLRHIQRDPRAVRRRDDLLGHAVDRREARAERIVAGDDGIERGCQRGDVQDAAQPDRLGDIVERAVWLELVEEPQPLLREGERRGGRAIFAHGARTCHDRRRLAGGLVRPQEGRVDLRRRGSRPWATRRCCARASSTLNSLRSREDKLRGEQGMPAQLEEVVERADLLDAQDGRSRPRPSAVRWACAGQRTRLRRPAASNRARAAPCDRLCR